jgi:cob(I)alamin adenosyltransferase
MGGLASAVQSLRGKAPRIAHVDTSRPEAPLARPLSHEISRVVRGRAANPKWIAGVMRHGYKGAFEIAATVDYLFGFAASTEAVSSHHFDQLFAAYLEDERVRDFMQTANPAALRETTTRFAEAIRRGLWTPRSNRAAHLIAELLPEATKEKARKHKAARDKIMATKTGEKGLLIVHTGTGKGKTSAALGMVFRHIGHGYPVAVVQFTKSPAWDTGEARVLAKFPDLVTLHIMGEGFTWETQDRARDIAAATAGWERAKELIRDDRHQMVLLDELNIVLRYEYLPIEDVVNFLRDEKPADKHVVITGRNAHASLIEMADLVTEMTLIKHPFRQGVKAQKGVEF